MSSSILGETVRRGASTAAAVLSFTLLLIGSKRHGPLYYAGRSVVMGAWAYYFFRPKVVAYFRLPTASS